MDRLLIKDLFNSANLILTNKGQLSSDIEIEYKEGDWWITGKLNLNSLETARRLNLEQRGLYLDGVAISYQEDLKFLIGMTTIIHNMEIPTYEVAKPGLWIDEFMELMRQTKEQSIREQMTLTIENMRALNFLNR
jgi:hypothetical protein